MVETFDHNRINSAIERVLALHPNQIQSDLRVEVSRGLSQPLILKGHIDWSQSDTYFLVQALLDPILNLINSFWPKLTIEQDSFGGFVLVKIAEMVSLSGLEDVFL